MEDPASGRELSGFSISCYFGQRTLDKMIFLSLNLTLLINKMGLIMLSTQAYYEN